MNEATEFATATDVAGPNTTPQTPQPDVSDWAPAGAETVEKGEGPYGWEDLLQYAQQYGHVKVAKSKHHHKHTHLTPNPID